MFLFNSMATAGAVGGLHGCCNAFAWDLRMRADRIDTWNRSFPLLFYRRNCMCSVVLLFPKTPFFDPPSIWPLLRFSYYCYHIPVSENAYPKMWNGWSYECKDPSEVSFAFPADTAMGGRDEGIKTQWKKRKQYKNIIKRVGSAYAAFDKTVQEASQIRLVIIITDIMQARGRP